MLDAILSEEQRAFRFAPEQQCEFLLAVPFLFQDAIPFSLRGVQLCESQFAEPRVIPYEQELPAATHSLLQVETRFLPPPRG